MDVAPDAEPPWLVLPAGPGVAVFEGARGEAVLIATSADVRGLARSRLGPAGAGLADHRAITRRVLGYATGSMLEADVLYLEQARLRMPAMHRIVSERWRAWTVQVDPEVEHPRWTAARLEPGPRAPAGRVLGPFPDRSSAARLIERVIDAFDLCREHHLLVQAPHARACPYKEMGRCAAPCDGSEPMASYRARVARAAGVIADGAEAVRRALEADMLAASGQNEFELAAELKRQADRLGALTAPGLAHAADLADWNLAIVVPGAGAPAKRARVLAFGGGRLAAAGELDARADAAAAAEIARRVLGGVRSTWPLDEAGVDTIGAVMRWLHSPSSRRRGVAVRVRRRMTAEQLSGDLSAAAAVVWRSGRSPASEADQIMERDGPSPQGFGGVGDDGATAT